MSTSRSHAPQVAPLSSSGSTAAVIVTHNRVELLRASLEQVVAQTHPVKWVIVVDNGAETAVKNLVEELAGERAVYVASKTNLGGAGGFALGFLTALSLGADAIWCADDDGRPADAAVLAELYRVAEANQLHEVSPAVCNINDPGALAFPLRQGLVWRRRMEELEGDFLPGIASLFNGALISAKAMEIIGVPDYRLFIRGDEVEYHRRLVNSGLNFGTALTCAYLHPDGSDEFKPILGGKMHSNTQKASSNAISPTATVVTCCGSAACASYCPRNSHALAGSSSSSNMTPRALCSGLSSTTAAAAKTSAVLNTVNSRIRRFSSRFPVGK